ncbi:MAG: hypothetical protein ACXU9O_07075 [Gemmatimonadaceae bacterium]
MIFFLLIFGAPIAYAVVLLMLVIRRDTRGFALSLLFAAVVVMSAVWAMDQSRSSTRGLAFLGFPLMATLGGFLGLAFGRYRTSSDASRRIGAWLGLAGTLALIGFNISGGLKEKTKNKGRDATQAAFSAEISRDRDTIAAALKANPGRERAWLDSSVRTRMTDRAFLLAALPNDSMPPGLLDTLANSTDLNIALEAVRNPNMRPETLEHVYRSKSYPDYFFQALAAHHNTPPSVLLELYKKPRTIMMLDIWFAGNSSTPHEILDEISRTATDRSIIGALLENPALDCGMLTHVAMTLMKTQNRDADNPNVARVAELVPKLCPNKATQ